MKNILKKSFSKSPSPQYPRVDIIVLSYNGKEDTLECLESLRNLDYPNYRTTVVDNASADGSADAVADNFPEVNLIRSPVNLRFAGGNNLALKSTLKEDFQYALLLNNDVVCEPDFLSLMVNSAESRPDVGLAAPKIRYYQPREMLWFAGGSLNLKFAYMRHRGIGQMDRGQFDIPDTQDFLNGACLLVKAEVFRKTGLLDEDFFLYGEDLDFCIRARKAGYTLWYEPSAIIYHKVSRSSPPLKKLQYRYRAWIQVAAKHTPIYFRPLQAGNLLLEFIPLVFGFIARKIRFALRSRR